VAIWPDNQFGLFHSENRFMPSIDCQYSSLFKIIVVG